MVPAIYTANINHFLYEQARIQQNTIHKKGTIRR